MRTDDPIESETVIDATFKINKWQSLKEVSVLIRLFFYDSVFSNDDAIFEEIST